ncbi:MAG: hypothetical protein IKF17_02850 [Clostridia bacterium]|nr:hypothetical protein [Clostridia bacterium]
MNYICIIITAIVIAIMLAVIFKLNPKSNKELAQNEELNIIAKKFPTNKEICKNILKKLNNETVTIEEDKNAKDCLYIAITNKIIIAGIQDNFTRIQTIAHECLHSVQDRRVQIANFIISNVCILYYAVAIVLEVFNILPENMEITLLTIYVLLGFSSYVIRAYLENDAMIKAKYFAKEYMEEQDVCSKEEIEKIVDGFEQINSNGIKGVNFSLILGVIIRIVILAGIFMIR